MTIDKWDRFQYLRMMFANGYKNARNLRDLIKHEFNASDSERRRIDYLEQAKRATVENDRRYYKKYPINDWEVYTHDYYGGYKKELDKLDKIEDELEKINKMYKAWK